MKKLLWTTAAIMALTILPAHAENTINFKPYIGLDLMRLGVNYTDDKDVGGGFTLDGDTLLEDSLNGAGVHVGARFLKYLGVELSYFRMKDGEKDIAAGTAIGSGLVTAAPFSTTVKLQGFAFDGMGYLPVTESGSIELIGTAGLSWMKAEIEGAAPGLGSANSDASELGFRVGGGAQINLNDEFSLRGLARYQSADFDGYADSAWIYSLGLNYSF